MSDDEAVNEKERKIKAFPGNRMKALQPQLLEERKKGNIAYLKYDKIIIKEPNTNNDKRKREQSTSPQSPSKTQPKNNNR
ncbi:unnamed protein product [Leptidea sinapis]|uniref:Uncharacterized protein n=1 Tax=Leptidea sinapis TaxID=189913 RepID=A0A5E4R368_9NEOP|nr:unnamed protein product [Leptidea sinapis]